MHNEDNLNGDESILSSLIPQSCDEHNSFNNSINQNGLACLSRYRNERFDFQDEEELIDFNLIFCVH